MEPIEIVGLVGAIALAVFVLTCGGILVTLARAAKLGDNIALRAQEDRDLDDQVMRNQFSDPNRFDADHGADR